MKTVFSFKFKKVDEENKVSDSKQSFTNSVQINKQNNNNIKEKKNQGFLFKTECWSFSRPLKTKTNSLAM